MCVKTKLQQPGAMSSSNFRRTMRTSFSPLTFDPATSSTSAWKLAEQRTCRTPEGASYVLIDDDDDDDNDDDDVEDDEDNEDGGWRATPTQPDDLSSSFRNA